MNRNSFVKPGHAGRVTLPGGGRRATALPVLCVCMALGWGSLFADGVTRTVEPVDGGCRVTLAWAFSGAVESDLIIEERLARGWSVDDATVPFGSLDASWFSGSVARFAVKPALLAQPGSISFTVVSGEGATSGAIAGDWKMYLGGALRNGVVAGANGLAVLSGVAGGASCSSGASGASSSSESGVAGCSVAVPVTITSFKIDGAGIVLAYSGVAKAGTLLVEGCEDLGKSWKTIKGLAVSAGDGNVALEMGKADACRYFRLKFLTEAELIQAAELIFTILLLFSIPTVTIKTLPHLDAEVFPLAL